MSSSAPESFNIAINGTSNDTDIILDSANSVIGDNIDPDVQLLGRIVDLETSLNSNSVNIYGPPEFVALNEKIKSIEGGIRNAISGDGKTIAIILQDYSQKDNINNVVEIRSEDSSKDTTIDLADLPVENATLLGSDVREIYLDDAGNTLVLGDSSGFIIDKTTGQIYGAGRVIIYNFDSLQKKWINTLNYVGTNENLDSESFLSVGWSVSISGDGKTAVAFSADYTEPYPGIDQEDLRIWKNIDNEWVLQVVEQPIGGLIGFAGCVAIDKQGENIVLFNRSTQVMYIFAPQNNVWKVKYSESFSNLFPDDNPGGGLGRVPPTIITMEDHYRISVGTPAGHIYVFQLSKSAISGPVMAFTKFPTQGYVQQMSGNSERIVVGEGNYDNARGSVKVYNLTYDNDYKKSDGPETGKPTILANLIYRVDGEISSTFGYHLSVNAGYWVSIDNDGKRMVTNALDTNLSDVQQVYLVDEPKLDNVYKTLLQSTQLNEKTLAVHEGLVTQNIADISENKATLAVHEGLVTKNIADIETLNLKVENCASEWELRHLIKTLEPHNPTFTFPVHNGSFVKANTEDEPLRLSNNNNETINHLVNMYSQGLSDHWTINPVNRINNAGLVMNFDNKVSYSGALNLSSPNNLMTVHKLTDFKLNYKFKSLSQNKSAAHFMFSINQTSSSYNFKYLDIDDNSSNSVFIKDNSSNPLNTNKLTPNTYYNMEIVKVGNKLTILINNELIKTHNLHSSNIYFGFLGNDNVMFSGLKLNPVSYNITDGDTTTEYNIYTLKSVPHKNLLVALFWTITTNFEEVFDLNFVPPKSIYKFYQDPWSHSFSASDQNFEYMIYISKTGQPSFIKKIDTINPNISNSIVETNGFDLNEYAFIEFLIINNEFKVYCYEYLYDNNENDLIRVFSSPVTGGSWNESTYNIKKLTNYWYTTFRQETNLRNNNDYIILVDVPNDYEYDSYGDGKYEIRFYSSTTLELVGTFIFDYSENKEPIYARNGFHSIHCEVYNNIMYLGIGTRRVTVTGNYPLSTQKLPPSRYYKQLWHIDISKLNSANPATFNDLNLINVEGRDDGKLINLASNGGVQWFNISSGVAVLPSGIEKQVRVYKLENINNDLKLVHNSDIRRNSNVEIGWVNITKDFIAIGKGPQTVGELSIFSINSVINNPDKVFEIMPQYTPDSINTNRPSTDILKPIPHLYGFKYYCEESILVDLPSSYDLIGDNQGKIVDSSVRKDFIINSSGTEITFDNKIFVWNSSDEKYKNGNDYIYQISAPAYTFILNKNNVETAYIIWTVTANDFELGYEWTDYGLQDNAGWTMDTNRTDKTFYYFDYIIYGTWWGESTMQNFIDWGYIVKV